MNIPNDLEQQLRSLTPIAAPQDEDAILYACGYEAGRRAALVECGDRSFSWPKLAAAVLLSGLLSGWGGYGLARHSASALVADQGWADAPRPLVPRPVAPTAEPSATISATPAGEHPGTLDPAAILPAAERPPTLTPPTVAPAFALLKWWSETPSRSRQVAGNGVILTAASGSEEWMRWMLERPAPPMQEETGGAAELAAPAAVATENSYLTPMNWRTSDLEFAQWLH